MSFQQPQTLRDFERDFSIADAPKGIVLLIEHPMLEHLTDVLDRFRFQDVLKIVGGIIKNPFEQPAFLVCTIEIHRGGFRLYSQVSGRVGYFHALSTERYDRHRCFPNFGVFWLARTATT